MLFVLFSEDTQVAIDRLLRLNRNTKIDLMDEETRSGTISFLRHLH